MVMIRCPNCGQRVLDVATACPQCHQVLLQNPLETHNWGALRECGRCHKHIDRDAIVCPYCGHRVRAARVATRIIAGLFLVVVLVAAVIAAFRAGIVSAVREAFVRPAPASEASPAPLRTPPGPALAEPQPEVTVPPVIAAVPESTTTEERPPAPTPQPTAQTPTEVASPAALVTRWTVEWANVRAERTVESPVVRVLAPNVRIQVADMRGGWWALYDGGAVVGFVANSLLRPAPLQS